jgi:hypothetical protein
VVRLHQAASVKEKEVCVILLQNLKESGNLQYKNFAFEDNNTEMDLREVDSRNMKLDLGSITQEMLIEY